jgi:hypothetical protein
MRHSKWIATLAMLAATAAVQAANVYRYVDARGETHYTDRPMPGAVLVRTTDPRPPAQAAAQQTAQARSNQTLSNTNQALADRQADARVQETVAKDLAATRAERCKKAREAYTKSINSQRIYNAKDGGQREYLNDSQLAQYRIDRQREVEAICGPQG